MTELRDILDRMYADLARSDLDKNDAKRLGIRALTAEDMAEISGGDKQGLATQLAGYEIPIFGINGDIVGTHYRLLPPPGEDPAKFLRYLHPAKQDNRFYFPPLLRNRTWADIAQDPKIPLAITEGAKKAACATKNGLPTIAVAGVWNWVFGIKRLGVDTWDKIPRTIRAIPDFDLIQWKNREVPLIFDADATTKPNVEMALNALAGESVKRGAKPVQILLPQDANQGKLDDFLVANEHDLRKLLALKQREFEGAAKLWEINNKYAYLFNPPGMILRINLDGDDEPITLMRKSDLEMEIGNLKVGTSREFSFFKQFGPAQTLSKMWLEWTHRASYTGVRYVPGQTKLEDNAYNVWTGWPVTPKAGNVAPMLKHINYITRSLTPAERKWFWQWLAYPIQHPGTKMFSAVLIIGPPGSGKNLVGTLMQAIYGRNYCLIGPGELHGDFNSDLLGRQFCFADEVFSTDRRSEVSQIKTMVTREKVRVSSP